ncbi:MAG: hypothetical protein SH857_03075 [Chitinophagales bacterium]|nr:hypothetical protein [Chitinophagales bacterium]
MNFKILTLIFLVTSSLMPFAQESPVQGDDLLKCLGQSRNSELAVKLNNYIGNKAPKEDISFLNYGKGIQVNIEQNTIKSIDLYSDDNPYSTEFKSFQGKLPMEIIFSNTIHQVKQKIGEGYEIAGDVMSTYQLIKIFKLNDDDDYRMTIEFNTGRIVMLSVSYVEGGAETTEGEDGAQQSSGTKFRGNDFFTMMKKNSFNREFTLFKRILAPAMHPDKTRSLYINDGVDVRFVNGAIQSITLYSGGQQSDYKGMPFEPYRFDLPYGMRMENTKSGIIKKLGSPVSDTGNIISYRERIAEIQIAFKGEKIDWVRIKVAEAQKAQ